MSIVWVWFSANLLVDFIEILGVLTGASAPFLGVTLLAWGNITGDFIASLSISRKGFGEMALTGCFAGPMFDFGFGIGLVTLKSNLETGVPLNFDYNDKEATIPIAMIFAQAAAVLFCVMAAYSNNFTLSMWSCKARILYFVGVIGVLVFRFVVME